MGDWCEKVTIGEMVDCAAARFSTRGCMQEYPMTSSGKVQKLKLREMSVEALGLASTARA